MLSDVPQSQPLPVAEGDSPTRQIVRRELDDYTIPWQHANIVLTHLSAKVTEDGMPIVELDREHGVWKRLHYLPVHGDRVWILPAHALLGGIG